MLITWDSQPKTYVPTKKNQFPDPKFTVHGMHYMVATCYFFVSNLIMSIPILLLRPRGQYS